MSDPKNMGCPFRKWGWHDGGPDHLCTKDGNQNTCCEDSYSDWFQCEDIKKELKIKEEPHAR